MPSNAANINVQVLEEFLLESSESLSTINDQIMQLEKKPDDLELLNAIYRKIHTLKGSAGFLNFKGLQQISHAAENLLDLLRESRVVVTPHVIDALLSTADVVTEVLKQIETTGSEPEYDNAKVLTKLLAAAESGSSPGPVIVKDLVLPIEAEASTHGQCIKNNAEAGAVLPQKSIQKEQGNDQSTRMRVETSAAAKEDESPSNNDQVLAGSTVRVNVKLLDKIMNVVGELVLTRNQILQFSNSRELPELYRLSQQLNLIATELQTDIMTTRMQPIGSVLTKFERIVRDMARDLSKKISLKITGKETELDKSLLEAIKDPLTHIVRNSVDHGIEAPEVRVQRGKSEEGTISIRSYHESGQVTIEIKDDGGGIARDKVIAKAIERGLLNADTAQKMSERQVLNLIFLPGFSTAEKVSNISGRGVGMDVVKTNIEKIGGVVDISSVEGEGTTIKLKIPLTLAIVPALIVRSNNESFAIPQINLVELVRFDKGDSKNGIEKLHDAYFFRLRGALIPLVNLNEVLKLDQIKTENATSTISENKEKANGSSVNIVVLNAEGTVFGLIVDSILDTVEIVVKPLGKQLKCDNLFAGATIMGDGRVALILDALGFAQSNHLNKEQSKEINTKPQSALQSSDQTEMLLFTLPTDGYFAVPLSLVHRLEELSKDKIEYTGDLEVVRYRNETMPLIDLCKNLNLTLKDKSDWEKSVVPLIVVRYRNKSFGIKVSEIHDIEYTESGIDDSTSDRSVILGTTFMNGKIVSVIDIFAVLEEFSSGLSQCVKPNEIKKKNKTVLVVEDSPLFRKIEAKAIMADGFDVLEVHDGIEAMELLRTQAVDLVLSDIEMPRMDGIQLAKAIRSDSKLSSLPLIALTTKVDEESVKVGLKEGFQYYLEKFKREEVLAAINKMLHREETR